MSKPSIAPERRLTATGTGLIAASAGLITLLVFAVQNSARADVHFLWIAWSGAPLYAIIVISFVLGAMVGAILMVLGRRRARSRRPRPPAAPGPPRGYRPPGVSRPPAGRP